MTVGRRVERGSTIIIPVYIIRQHTGSNLNAPEFMSHEHSSSTRNKPTTSSILDYEAAGWVITQQALTMTPRTLSYCTYFSTNAPHLLSLTSIIIFDTPNDLLRTSCIMVHCSSPPHRATHSTPAKHQHNRAVGQFQHHSCLYKTQAQDDASVADHPPNSFKFEL